jgi:hypothetical protein
MTSGAASHQEPLVAALRCYLERNPEAADSLEGIRRWWLPSSLQSVPDAALQRALEAMVAAGAMQVRELPDDTRLYARSDTSARHAENESDD